MRGISRRTFISATVFLGVGGVKVIVAHDACAAGPPDARLTPTGDRLETVSKGEIPSFAKTGGLKVQEAYRFAAVNGDALQYIPCFCGCGNIGHRSNSDCYVTERHKDGKITFTSHAAT